MNGDYLYLYILRPIKYSGTCISPPDPNMQLFTFVSIAFVAFQVGVTANPIADPMPVPEAAMIGSPVVDRAASTVTLHRHADSD
ncbi:hypothetical protein B0H13DRAFT_2322105 [Mycena leptocephala]|nr:hypothetical protein B0H13DRAFT_2322105 [Mycena leptocephala]